MDASDQILAIGRRMLADEGLRAITTNAIAQQARVSKKTLYKHFASKDVLIEAILVSFMEENLKHWDTILESPDPAIERVMSSLRFVSEFLPQVQLRIINQVESVAPQLWATLDAIRTKRLMKLKTLIEDVKDDGYFRLDVNPDHWLLLLIGAVRSVVTPQGLLRAGVSLGEILQSIQTIFFSGLLTDRGRRYVVEKENL